MIVCDISDDEIYSSIPKDSYLYMSPNDINRLKISRINHAILTAKVNYTNFPFNDYCCKEVQEILTHQPKMFRNNSSKPNDYIGNYYYIDFYESEIKNRIDFVDENNKVVDYIIIDTIGKKQRSNNTIDDILKD